jgi:hypothetical protein
MDLSRAHLLDVEDTVRCRGINQADSGLSQMTSVGGVDGRIAVGAYHDLEGDVSR